MIKIAFSFFLAILFTLYPGTLTLDWLHFHQKHSLLVVGFVVFSAAAISVFIFRLFKFLKKCWEKVKNFKYEQSKAKKDKDFFEGFLSFEKEDFDSSITILKGDTAIIRSYILAKAYLKKKNLHQARIVFDALSNPFLRAKGLIHIAFLENEWIRAHHLLEEMKKFKGPWIFKRLSFVRIKLLELQPSTPLESLDKILPFWEKQKALEKWMTIKDSSPSKEGMLTTIKSIFPNISLIPEVVMFYAKALINANKIDHAKRLVFNNFNQAPSRALVKFYLQWLAPKDGVDAYKVLEESIQKDHPESLWCLAKTAYQFGFFGQAKEYLKPLPLTQEVFVLKKCLNISEEFLDEILRPNPAWVCKGCQKQTLLWQIYCSHCFLVDAFEWQWNLL